MEESRLTIGTVDSRLTTGTVTLGLPLKSVVVWNMRKKKKKKQKKKNIHLDSVKSEVYYTGGQLSRVVKASDLGAEGPRFEPWQQHLVQLSYLLRGGAVAMVTELALN